MCSSFARSYAILPEPVPTVMGGGGGADAPSIQCYAKALADYKGEEAGELSFAKDDTIVVLEKGDDGWWKGILNGKVGYFPGNGVVEIPAE